MTHDISYAALIERLCQRVRGYYQHQVLDESRRDDGAFLVGEFYGFGVAAHTAGGQALAEAIICLFAPASPLREDEELAKRVGRALAFQCRVQRPTGLIDLPKVDFDSPPDTAFMVEQLSFACRVARTVESPLGKEIAERLAEFLWPAAKGIIGKGFRTPNHRWVIVSALSQATVLFPALDALDYIESILAEGADINADGEWSERSTGVYSAVCNRAWRLAAEALGRAEYLDLVRANLDFMAALLNSDGTVVTSISQRQDGGKKVVPVTMADSFLDLGQIDGNPRWTGIAELLVGTGEKFKLWLLQPYLDHPDRIGKTFPSQPLPQSYDRFFPASKLWRLSDGVGTVTACADNDAPLSLQCGGVTMRGLRVRGGYFNLSNFRADEMEYSDGRLRMLHLSAKRDAPAWDLPLGRRVEFSNPHTGFYPLVAKGIRQRWPLPRLDLALEISRVTGGLDLTLTSDGGYDLIPFAIEFWFDVGLTLQSPTLSLEPAEGSTLFHQQGEITVHDGTHAIRVSPGADAHVMQDLIDGPPINGCFRVVVALMSPLNHTIALRWGLWSTAIRSMIL